MPPIVHPGKTVHPVRWLRSAKTGAASASVDTSKPAIDRHFKTGHHGGVATETAGLVDVLRLVASRPSVFVFLFFSFFFNTKVGCGNVGISHSGRDFQVPCGNRSVVSIGTSFP